MTWFVYTCKTHIRQVRCFVFIGHKFLLLSIFVPVWKTKLLLKFRWNDWLYLCCLAQTQICFAKTYSRKWALHFHVLLCHWKDKTLAKENNSIFQPGYILYNVSNRSLSWSTRLAKQIWVITMQSLSLTQPGKTRLTCMRGTWSSMQNIYRWTQGQKCIYKLKWKLLLCIEGDTAISEKQTSGDCNKWVTQHLKIRSLKRTERVRD